ncbi:MAG: CPBP family intramembrane metalloprotease [Gemmatimonadota bacterium]|nr:MAG: CPBP family intramembrane metalloprotease [Gemmatimonadota bacterium]
MNRLARPNFLHLFLVFLAWILIGELTPYLRPVLDIGRLTTWLLAALRMTIMLLVTYLYIRLAEGGSFSTGFNLRFEQVPKNLLWAFVFFLLSGVVLMLYQFLIVRPLLAGYVEASGMAHAEGVRPFGERLVDYLYIVYEGVVEVLIFIGFLIDRLARAWKWPAAIVVGNLAFAFWHYGYLSSGLLAGSLMMILTFLAGVTVTLSYVKTRNTLSPIICHALVDSPSSIRILLGFH